MFFVCKNWIATSKKILSGLCLDYNHCFSRSGEDGETVKQAFINPVRDTITNAALELSILELLQLVSK